MSPLNFLRLINGPTKGSVLDLGCGDCRYSKKFVEAGFVVDAVDSAEQPTCAADGVTFIHSRVEDFKSEKAYDVVVAWSMLWFTELEPQNVLEKLLSFANPGGAILCNFLLERDSWVGREHIKTTTKEVILHACEKFGVTIAFQGELFYDGPDRKDRQKTWHMLILALRKN